MQTHTSTKPDLDRDRPRSGHSQATERGRSRTAARELQPLCLHNALNEMVSQLRAPAPRPLLPIRTCYAVRAGAGFKDDERHTDAWVIISATVNPLNLDEQRAPARQDVGCVEPVLLTYVPAGAVVQYCMLLFAL